METLITTSETLSADLKASLLKMDLEYRGICIARAAEKTARLAVSLHDPVSHDAAIWKGAEAAYDFLDSLRSDSQPLSMCDPHLRAYYLWIAIKVFANVRLALEGTFPPDRVAQAHADYTNHMADVGRRAADKRRRQLKVVANEY